MEPIHLQKIILSVRESARAALDSRNRLDQFAAETRELYTRREAMRKLAKSTGKPAFARQVEGHDAVLSQHGLVELKCTACPQTTRANCTCMACYLPAKTKRADVSAHFRAAQLIAAHPEWSNRKIAQGAGTSEGTVRKARKGASTEYAPEYAPERIGLDDKTYAASKIKARKAVALPSPDDDLIQDPCEDCETQEQFWQTSLSNVAGDAIAMRAYWTRLFGDWSAFETPSALVTLAKQAAQEWTALAKSLEQRRNR